MSEATQTENYVSASSAMQGVVSDINALVLGLSPAVSVAQSQFALAQAQSVQFANMVSTQHQQGLASASSAVKGAHDIVHGDSDDSSASRRDSEGSASLGSGTLGSGTLGSGTLGSGTLGDTASDSGLGMQPDAMASPSSHHVLNHVHLEAGQPLAVS